MIGLLQVGQVVSMAKARLSMFREMDSAEDYGQDTDEYLAGTAAWYRQELQSGTLLVLCAWRGDELLGAAHLRLEDRPPHPGYQGNCHGHVSGVYVVPPFRGQGLGATLMEALHVQAASRGVKRLHLHSTEKAMKLYRRLGYIRRDNALSKDLS